MNESILHDDAGMYLAKDQAPPSEVDSAERIRMN
jgi:hypothetical protein